MKKQILLIATLLFPVMLFSQTGKVFDNLSMTRPDVLTFISDAFHQY